MCARACNEKIAVGSSRVALAASVVLYIYTVIKERINEESLVRKRCRGCNCVHNDIVEFFNSDFPGSRVFSFFMMVYYIIFLNFLSY